MNAIEEIDRIEIKPSYFKISTGRPYVGYIVSHDVDKKTLKLKVDEGFDDMMRTYYNLDYKHQNYDVTFYSNRLVFQLQHQVLKWLKNHDLFNVLIQNPEYKMFPNRQNREYFEREYLNDEQNLAVNNILSLHDSVPFLLFGPPGKQNETNTPRNTLYINILF